MMCTMCNVSASFMCRSVEDVLWSGDTQADIPASLAREQQGEHAVAEVAIIITLVQVLGQKPKN